MPPLLALFTANPTLEMLRAAAATLSAFFRASPFPAVDPDIPVLALLLRLNHCDDALKSAVVVVSNLSGGSNSETIQRICHSEIISALVSLFQHSTALIQREALGTIFNIVAALDSQHTQIVVENGVLPGLFRLLTNTEDSEVMKKICQIVFNIAVLDRSSVIESGITKHIIHLLNLNDTEIKTYALRTIFTITSEQNHDHIRLLVSQGCIEGLSNVLDPTEGDIVLAALGVLEVIFEVETNGGGEDFPYRRMFIQAGGLQQMDEAVFTHADDHDINLRYDRIIMGYFKDS
ncbi:PREDICTED: importin subunit alpha-6-like [Camelina sativa]|uniref:Importin subunit alpha-6-like n=1 Tax=Camelina sativa TaxID=90675 RepID=A0ABM0SXJ8_CAMSA|nr:PREDICTED: importin subunit alpha-6-like [Camelina sativa]